MLKLPKMAAKAAAAAAPTQAHAKAAFAPSGAAEPRVLSQWFTHVEAHRAFVPAQLPRVGVNMVKPKQVRFAPLPPKAKPRRLGGAPTIRIVDGVLEIGDDCPFGFSFSPRNDD